MVVRSALMYGTECCPIRKSHVRRTRVVEIRMIRWMCGHMRFDKIRNEVIRGRICIEDKMRDARLRWFGHIRRSMDAPMRRYKNFGRLHHRRSRGRPKKSLSKVIRHDLKTLGLVEDIAHDRRLWRSTINVANV